MEHFGMEEAYELKPGLQHIGKHIMDHVCDLGRARSEYHYIGSWSKRHKKHPYWPGRILQKRKTYHESMYYFYLCLYHAHKMIKAVFAGLYLEAASRGLKKAFWKKFLLAPGKNQWNRKTWVPLKYMNKGLWKKTYRTIITCRCSFRILLPMQRRFTTWTKMFLNQR